MLSYLPTADCCLVPQIFNAQQRPTDHVPNTMRIRSLHGAAAFAKTAVRMPGC
jgi:hypothetical protein